MVNRTLKLVRLETFALSQGIWKSEAQTIKLTMSFCKNILLQDILIDQIYCNEDLKVA